MVRKRVVMILAFAMLLAAAPTQAKPLLREHYSGTDSFDFDGCGFTIHDDVTFKGVFMVKAPRADGAPPYLSDNYESHETLSANGKWFTIDHQGLYKDLHITLVSGTIYQFTSMETGRPFVVRDSDGNRVLSDRGRLLTTFQVDTKGDTDLDNDEFIDGSWSLLADEGRHPGFYADFCADIAIPLLG